MIPFLYMSLCAQNKSPKTPKFNILLKILFHFSDVYLAVSKNCFNNSGEKTPQKHIYSQGRNFFYHHLIHSSVSPGWKVSLEIPSIILPITPPKHNINHLYGSCKRWTWKRLPPEVQCVRICVNFSKEAETWVQTVFRANFSSHNLQKQKNSFNTTFSDHRPCAKIMQKGFQGPWDAQDKDPALNKVKIVIRQATSIHHRWA